MACLYADGKMDIGDLLLHENVIGTVFEGRILSHVRIGGYRAVIPEIYGNTYVTLYLSWRIPRLVQPISKRVLNYTQLPNYREQMGYQHKVMDDLFFVYNYLQRRMPNCKMIIIDRYFGSVDGELQVVYSHPLTHEVQQRGGFYGCVQVLRVQCFCFVYKSSATVRIK